MQYKLRERGKAFGVISPFSLPAPSFWPHHLMLAKPRAIDAMYQSYIVYEGDFYRIKFEFDHLNNRHSLDHLGMPVNRTQWDTGVAVVNAFYTPTANEITLPAAILLPVFFNDKYPSSMNFGGIGVVIGHEITHGFANCGEIFDYGDQTVEQYSKIT